VSEDQKDAHQPGFTEFRKAMNRAWDNAEVPYICTCDEFKKALEGGSDSEGYGSAIDLMTNGNHLIGGIQAPIRFCPWCGKRTPKDGE